MKFLKQGLVLGLAALLLATTAATAVAAPRIDTVDIDVENRTGSTVFLTLNGPGETARVSISANESMELSLEPGEYFYKYMACGHLNTGFYTAGVGQPALVLKKCGGMATSNIVIENQTGSPFVLTLSGQQPYGFWIPPGGITIQVLAGGYQFSSNACDVDNGVLKASASRPQPLIWTFECGSQTLISSGE
jgi:hypothetical protein